LRGVDLQDLEVEFTVGEAGMQLRALEFRGDGAHHLTLVGPQDAVAAVQHRLGVERLQAAADGLQARDLALLPMVDRPQQVLAEGLQAAMFGRQLPDRARLNQPVVQLLQSRL